MMTTKTMAMEQQTVQDGNKLASVMTVAAWIALTIGVITCLVNVTEFSDRNLGLMIGVGFLIGSVQIYMIGAAIRLFHRDKSSRSSI